MSVDDNSPSTSKRGLFSSRREEIIERQYNEIKKLECKFRNLYEGAPDMYRTINTHGIVIDCNKAYVNDLGYSAKDEVIGHSIFEHAAEQSLDAMRDSFEEWRRTGMVRNKEVWFKRKDGSTFPVLISANNLYDDDGNLIGSNSAIIDETDTYRARKQLEKANEQLKEVQKLKDEFISIASHELRTPIQPILSYVELAERGLVEDKNALDIIRVQAQRLKKLADDILDVSRIESGNLNYDMQRANINEIILEVTDSCKYVQISKTPKMRRQISIETKLGSDFELHVDKTRMAQALSNILQNSIKFTEEGEITVETTVMAEKRLFEIKISDTGMGISSEILPKLFGKFVTRTTGDDVNKHGTGLGLFITRSIIQAHGGDIFAYNNENGKGATFVIRLPIK
jgi:PAS domain S-box-containing protein